MSKKRFEVQWFHGMNLDQLKAIAKLQPGVSNVRVARQFGWSNQPLVIRFSGDDTARGHVQHAVCSLAGAPFCIITEV